MMLNMYEKDNRLLVQRKILLDIGFYPMILLISNITFGKKTGSGWKIIISRIWRNKSYGNRREDSKGKTN